MIPQIKEINFPEYATLSTATATHVDMGDKTITAQVRIDGSIVPDFSYDWEIEFQGERYIQPLREPQASKGNESISSLIDLTFYHKGIYDLKRYFFVSIAEVGAGTIMADNYIVPLALNIGSFVDYLNKVLEYYYGNTYKVHLNPEWEYDETDVKYIDINYTKIWDVLTQVHDTFGARWFITKDGDDTFAIKIGYPSDEVTHVFEYGFEGGLLKFERQVQDVNIRNQMFGRGGSQNLPYRYFKKVDPNNTAWKADPDWIPELELINFAELRGKSFRDYVRGWKAKHYGGQAYLPPTDAYRKGFTDEKFDPVDYVEDKDSIAKYGLIQGGLDNNEEIYPTIQKRDLGNGLGRADEIIAVEEVLVDEPTSNGESQEYSLPIVDDNTDATSSVNTPRTIHFLSSTYQVPLGYKGYFVKDYNIKCDEQVYVTRKYSGFDQDGRPITYKTSEELWEVALTSDVTSVKVIDDYGNEISDVVDIPEGTSFKVEATIEVSNFLEAYREIVDKTIYGVPKGAQMSVTPDDTCKVITSLDWALDLTPINGIVIGNYTNGVERISKSTTIAGGESKRVTLQSEIFETTRSNATNVDTPIRITSNDDTSSYSYTTTINAINVSTGEVLDALNMSEGTYYIQVVVDITNLSNSTYSYKVELMPSYIYYPYDSSKWRPTFDIWIKDIWGIKRLNNENDTSYAERIWRPILGDRQGNEAKVVFSSGWLSGHSDWEFPIVAFAYDDSKMHNGVASYWRLTLAKSDAEMDATGKWIPSIATQANAGDFFYFIGIDMPHQYVLWAEEEVDKWKRENMPSQIKPTYIVQTDKIRLNEVQGEESHKLLDNLRIGKILRIADSRFIDGDYETLHLQSITYTWDASTIMFPNVEVVLSENTISSTNPIKETQHALSQITINIKDVEQTSKLEFRKLNRSTTSNTNKTNEVSVQVSKTQEVALGAQNIAIGAQNSAMQAKEGIVAVGNEVGTLKTTVTSTQNIASNAQLTANNAMSEIGRVSNETSTKFNSVDNSINGIERDVSALEGLIGDEYNIWFENGGQQGNVPTLDNYPALDWTSDDDYFNHDKDLYYSITLGRAWRFMYNEGEPFWEEITDADTITALTKAKEALDKANEAIDAVHDLDYLKAVFGDTEVMNEHAVILSRLLAVSDDYDNVVAGVYGGGVDGLDDNGYKDNSHGTLMMFAGADDAQHASTADFRVYSDGCIFANSGTFGGIMKRAKKVVSSANLKEFTYLDVNAKRVLDLTKTGSFITFGALSTPNLTIRLPWYSSDASKGSIDNFDDLLSILGTKIIVKFSTIGRNFCFSVGLFTAIEDGDFTGGDVTPICVGINIASTYVFECKAGKDRNGATNVGWEMTVL